MTLHASLRAIFLTTMTRKSTMSQGKNITLVPSYLAARAKGGSALRQMQLRQVGAGLVIKRHVTTARLSDERHLWPEFQRLIEKRRPSVVMGEQSSNATDWLHVVRRDLEALDYAVGVEAASAGADVLGDRFWFVATTNFVEFRGEPQAGQQSQHQLNQVPRTPHSWRSDEWRRGKDGKLRLVDPGIRWMAHGVSARMGKISCFGNAIDPRPAVQVIKAFIDVCLDCMP